MADNLDPTAVERAVQAWAEVYGIDPSLIAESDSRAIRAALAAAGLLVTPEHDAQVAARALRNWGQEMLARYPEGVFVEPDENGWRFIALALARQARTLDAVSASLMRRAAKLAIEDADRIERQEGER